MRLEELTIADFETIASEMVKALGIKLYECEVKANYNLGRPTKAEIKVSNRYVWNEGKLFTWISILLQYLKVNSSYKLITMKIPFTEEQSTEKQEESKEFIKQLFGNKILLGDVTFKVTSNKLLNLPNLNSANRPNSYTITIEY